MLGKYGLLAEERDVEALADAMTRSLLEPWTPALAQENREWAIERYSGAASARMLVDLWQRALTRQARMNVVPETTAEPSAKWDQSTPWEDRPQDRERAWGARYFSWGFISQGFSSATNLGLSVLAARALGSGGLGVVAIAFSTYLMALGFGRAIDHAADGHGLDASPVRSEEARHGRDVLSAPARVDRRDRRCCDRGGHQPAVTSAGTADRRPVAGGAS